jgi:hypothetical protein
MMSWRSKIQTARSPSTVRRPSPRAPAPRQVFLTGRGAFLREKFFVLLQRKVLTTLSKYVTIRAMDTLNKFFTLEGA